MPFYKVTNTYQYTAETYVEADSEGDAIGMSQDAENRNHDDTWWDSRSEEIDEDTFMEEK